MVPCRKGFVVDQCIIMQTGKGPRRVSGILTIEFQDHRRLGKGRRYRESFLKPSRSSVSCTPAGEMSHLTRQVDRLSIR